MSDGRVFLGVFFSIFFAADKRGAPAVARRIHIVKKLGSSMLSKDRGTSVSSDAVKFWPF